MNPKRTIFPTSKTKIMYQLPITKISPQNKVNQLQADKFPDGYAHQKLGYLPSPRLVLQMLLKTDLEYLFKGLKETKAFSMFSSQT